MPLRVRLTLVLGGVAAIVLSAIVMIRNKSPDDELLASIGVLGGLAIIITAIVVNGKDHHE